MLQKSSFRLPLIGKRLCVDVICVINISSSLGKIRRQETNVLKKMKLKKRTPTGRAERTKYVRLLLGVRGNNNNTHNAGDKNFQIQFFYNVIRVTDSFG